MSNPSPKIEKMMKAQAISSVVVVLGVSALTIGVTVSLLGMTVGAFFISLAAAWVLSRLGISFMSFFWSHFYYNGDTNQIIKEADAMSDYYDQKSKTLLDQPGEMMMLKITDVPKDPLGFFMDAPFYEWIEVLAADGKNLKMNFFGTMDLKSGATHAIPDGCVLLPPGILYQVEPAVNTGT